MSTALLLGWSVFGLPAAAADELEPVNPVPGVQTWKWNGDGLSLRLTQILPDQIRGFYQARGFGAADAELIARDCVFQTVIKNEASQQAIQLDLAGWRVETAKGRHPLRLESEWQALWKKRAVPHRARLAFRWALFPVIQSFERGDWNMGMTTYGLANGEVFNLHFNWHSGGRQFRGVLKKLQCPKDSAEERS